MKYPLFRRGFTLIELLVVIAVIGILASVVLASLSNARSKAKDAAARQAVREFEKLLALEFDQTGSYINLQPLTSLWLYPYSNCDTYFSGNYATQARAICKNIIANVPEFHIGNSSSITQRYSLMTRMNIGGQFICIGTSGTSSNVPNGSWNNTGCYSNP